MLFPPASPSAASPATALLEKASSTTVSDSAQAPKENSPVVESQPEQTQQQVHPSLIAIRELTRTVVQTEQERIRAEAEAEFQREMELIKQKAADLTYQRTGFKVGEKNNQQQQQQQSHSMIEKASLPDRGPELGKMQVRTVTGELEERHFGHGVFQRMHANKGKIQQTQQLLQTASTATPMPAPTPAVHATAPNARSFRFRSWATKAPSDLAGFHVSLAESTATVTATAEEQARLERELAGLESVLLETSSSTSIDSSEATSLESAATSAMTSSSATSSHQSDHDTLDAELENEHSDSFFELAHVGHSQKLGHGVGSEAHMNRKIRNNYNDYLIDSNQYNEEKNDNRKSEHNLMEIDSHSLSETTLNTKKVTGIVDASNLQKAERASIEQEIEDTAHSLAEMGKSKGMRKQINQIKRLNDYDKVKKERSQYENGISLAEVKATIKTTSSASTTSTTLTENNAYEPKTGFVTPPNEPGWPFSEPTAREHGYQPPNVNEMPGPSGYGNLNGYESHAYDTLLHNKPPESDRLQMGLSEPGSGGGAASLSPNNAVMNQMMSQARMIATGPNAYDVPVPYFPSQNPPPLAPMDKPAAPQTMMMQGTINQYMGPALRPFSNQHESLQSTRVPVTTQMNPPIGQGYGVSPSQHPRLTNVGGALEMRMLETSTKSRLRSKQSTSSSLQGTLQVDAGTKVGSGYSLPDMPGMQSQPIMHFPTSPHFNPNGPVPATIYPVPPGQSQTPYPYQVTSGHLPTSENLRMPQQVPGFYGDMQLPHASWAQVGHVDPSLQIPEYMSDTPYFPSESVGPAYPPAAIEQPVNAAGSGGRNYGGNLPFAPYIA